MSQRQEELLDHGTVPQVAVFIDGLNEFAFEAPEYTTEMQKFVSSPFSTALLLLHREMPLVRWIARKEYRGRPHRPAARRLMKYDDSELLDRRIERYLTNRRLIASAAAALGVRTLFVWQPVPTYKYDLRYHLFGSFHFGTKYYSGFGYARMAERLRLEPPDPQFLWAADMQEGVREPLYVDQIHYTAAMSKLLAERIEAVLRSAGVVPTRGHAGI